MKTLNIWQGLRFATMNPFYHTAAFIVGLCIINKRNHNSTRPIIEEDGSPNPHMTVLDVFYLTLFGHLFMILMDIVVALCKLRGRKLFKHEVAEEAEKEHLTEEVLVKDQEHLLNAWMVSADIIDLFAGYIYLLLNIYLSYVLGGEQVCSYFYNQPTETPAANCSDYFSQENAQVVYSLYSMNAFYSFFGGVILFLFVRTTWNSCRRKHITDVQSQFKDVLVYHKTDAAWIGFMFSIAYVNLVAIIFSSGLAKTMKDEGTPFSGSYGARMYQLYVTLFSTIVKLFAFFPLYKMVEAETKKEDDPVSEEPLLKTPTIGTKMHDDLIQALTMKYGGYQSSTVTKAMEAKGEIEHDLDDLWYKIMVKHVNTRCWPIWIAIICLDLATLIAYLVKQSSNDTGGQHYYTVVFLYWNFACSTALLIQFFGTWAFEKYKYKMADYSQLFTELKEKDMLSCEATKEQVERKLTRESKALYSKVEMGASISLLAYKSLHNKTREKMEYQLELILQTQFTFLFTVTIQIALVLITFGDFYHLPEFGVYNSTQAIYRYARFFCCMVMHLQSEPYIRYGLNMAKYATKHHDEFSAPTWAAFIGITQVIVTMSVALTCIFKIVSSDSIISTLSSYVAYTAISFLPGFVLVATPVGSKLKEPAPDLISTKWRRSIQEEKHDCRWWFTRICYRCIKIVYVSFWFYFLTLLPLCIPFFFTYVPAHDMFN